VKGRGSLCYEFERVCVEGEAGEGPRPRSRNEDARLPQGGANVDKAGRKRRRGRDDAGQSAPVLIKGRRDGKHTSSQTDRRLTARVVVSRSRESEAHKIEKESRA